MRPSLNACAAVLLLLTASPSAWSAKEDPITIEADRATLSEKQGFSTYTGNVVLTQGGIKITADEVTVRHENGQLTRVRATGKPVRYTQQGEGQQQDIHGEANVMEYFAAEQRLVLTEAAKLTQGGNAFSGNRIEYNTEREVVTATVSESGQDRVQVTIQPESLDLPEQNPQTNREERPQSAQ